MKSKTAALTIATMMAGLGLGQLSAADAAATAPAAPAAAGSGLVDPTISGYIDTTYNYNFDRPANQQNAFHSFDGQANTFALNSANVQLAGTTSDKNLSYLIEANIGSDGAVLNTANTSAGAGEFNLEQAYINYQIADSKFGFKAGKFVTYDGIEVIESINDATITRGFLFGLAEPYTHVGAVGTFQATSQVSVAAGVVNGWDEDLATNAYKTGVLNVHVDMGNPLVINGTIYYGPWSRVASPATNSSKRTTLDIVAETKQFANWDIFGQFNYGNAQNGAVGGGAASWFGLGVQPIFHINPTWQIGGRLEYLDDKDGFLTGVQQRLTTLSVAPGMNVTKNLLARAEFRVDFSNQDVYQDSTGAVNKKVQPEVAFELIYSY